MVGLRLSKIDRDFPVSSTKDWSRDFNQIVNEMNQLFSPSKTIDQNRKLWDIPCDIYETASNFILSLELPGVAREDINIEFLGDQLIVNAEKKQDHLIKDAILHRSERSYGGVKKAFSLSESVDKENIQANFENGILYISLPKSEVAKPRKIEVKDGKGGFLKNMVAKSKD